MESAPSFPGELEREIFETTALMHPSAIPSLLRVARRSLIWIEPFLYRVICSRQHPTILDATKSKPPTFFHSAVRHLFLDGTLGTWSPEEGNEILKLCTGVINFAAIGTLSNPALLPILADMRVRKMALCLEVLFGEFSSIDLGHPAFSSITHFDIFDQIEPTETKICPHIPALPALTHLCLNNEVPWGTIQALLTDCPQLELLVILWAPSSASDAYEWAKNSTICDARFVVAVFQDYWGDWEKGARGLPNFWSAAESFVAQKRSGLIDDTVCWMGEDVTE
ncbi:hypothetical protein B0H19DRAFT_1232218 [Mycena capillaripes]|nr:hypothetical protein B0H19DRAFT_1232218 [Mycena capillaripes]